MGISTSFGAGIKSVQEGPDASGVYFNKTATGLQARINSSTFGDLATATAFEQVENKAVALPVEQPLALHALAAHVRPMSPEQRDEQMPAMEFPDSLTWYVKVLPHANEYAAASEELPIGALQLRPSSGERIVRTVNRAHSLEESLVPATQISAVRTATTKEADMPTVPEPASLGVLALGTLAMLYRRR
jgi:hypothetical protein